MNGCMPFLTFVILYMPWTLIFLHLLAFVLSLLLRVSWLVFSERNMSWMYQRSSIVLLNMSNKCTICVNNYLLHFLNKYSNIIQIHSTYIKVIHSVWTVIFYLFSSSHPLPFLSPLLSFLSFCEHVYNSDVALLGLPISSPCYEL